MWAHGIDESYKILSYEWVFGQSQLWHASTEYVRMIYYTMHSVSYETAMEMITDIFRAAVASMPFADRPVVSDSIQKILSPRVPGEKPLVSYAKMRYALRGEELKDVRTFLLRSVNAIRLQMMDLRHITLFIRSAKKFCSVEEIQSAIRKHPAINENDLMNKFLIRDSID